MLLALALQAAQAEKCPWMNEATASGALHGAVTQQFTPRLGHQDIDGVCTFTRMLGGQSAELRIEVTTLNSTQRFLDDWTTCAHPLPLKALGNEAVECSPDHGDDGLSWQIVGRVRTRVFTLRQTVPPAPITSQDQQNQFRRLADIVAGNLY